MLAIPSIAPIARTFIVIAMLAFGAQHFIYGEFVTRLVPPLPSWIPWHPLWAYLTGAVLILCGAAMLFGIRARQAATLLGWIGPLSAVLLYLPRLLANPHNGGLWTQTG